MTNIRYGCLNLSWGEELDLVCLVFIVCKVYTVPTHQIMQWSSVGIHSRRNCLFNIILHSSPLGTTTVVYKNSTLAWLHTGVICSRCNKESIFHIFAGILWMLYRNGFHVVPCNPLLFHPAAGGDLSRRSRSQRALSCKMHLINWKKFRKGAAEGKQSICGNLWEHCADQSPMFSRNYLTCNIIHSLTDCIIPTTSL